jgi:hypothetical protein
VERYGKSVKIYLVHFGGGVSGHIRLVPRFLDWVEAGYKVYTDITWSIGFGARWLLSEIERRGVGADLVIFASDEPWSDFWGEYWKIQGAPVSSELKDRIFHRNFEELYGHKWRAERRLGRDRPARASASTAAPSSPPPPATLDNPKLDLASRPGGPPGRRLSRAPGCSGRDPRPAGG